MASALQALRQPAEAAAQQGDNGSKKKDKKQKKKEGKAEKEFDFSRHPTRHIALLIAYEGDKYAGFASQVRGWRGSLMDRCLARELHP